MYKLRSIYCDDDTLGETRDLGMEHVDIIDFMLKSTFCQLSIDGPLTVHLKEC